jgi:hypothetical protein
VIAKLLMKFRPAILSLGYAYLCGMQAVNRGYSKYHVLSEKLRNFGTFLIWGYTSTKRLRIAILDDVEFDLKSIPREKMSPFRNIFWQVTFGRKLGHFLLLLLCSFVFSTILSSQHLRLLG